MTVSSTEKLLRGRGKTVSRAEVISMYRTLEGWHFGYFTVGRRGRDSRFLWYIVPKELPAKLSEIESASNGASAATEAAVQAELPSHTPEMKAAASVDTAPAETIEHVYWLRRDTRVSVSMPRDLTQNEADRFAAFVKTLPLA
jgi:hypothetical protein